MHLCSPCLPINASLKILTYCIISFYISEVRGENSTDTFKAPIPEYLNLKSETEDDWNINDHLNFKAREASDFNRENNSTEPNDVNIDIMDINNAGNSSNELIDSYSNTLPTFNKTTLTSDHESVYDNEVIIDHKNKIEHLKYTELKFLDDGVSLNPRRSFKETLRSFLNEEMFPNSTLGLDMNNTSGKHQLNDTSSNSTKNNNSTQTKKVFCSDIDKQNSIGDVEVVNSTFLYKALHTNLNITTKSTPSKCYLVYFFSPYCPFSVQGSAYVNAFARSLPNIQVYALNSIDYHGLNARYGIMGTPSLVLFHNGFPVGRYNASEYGTYFLENFVHHFTNQKVLPINVTSHDFKANLPNNVNMSTPYVLYIAWAFLILCSSYVFLNSEFYARLTEAILNNWREAEAQHEHDD